MKPARDPKTLCCHCLGVTYGRVEQTIRTHRCRKVEEVTRLCRAGGGCRSCHPDIQDLLHEIWRDLDGRGFTAVLRRLFSRRTKA